LILDKSHHLTKNHFIVETTFEKIFKIKRINLKNFLIKSVKTEALFLFDFIQEYCFIFEPSDDFEFQIRDIVKSLLSMQASLLNAEIKIDKAILDIAKVKIERDSLKELEDVVMVKDLRLSKVEIRDTSFFEGINQSVEKLILNKTRIFSNEHISFENLTNLRELKIYASELSAKFKVSNLKNLQEFELCYCKFFKSSSITFDNLENLKSIRLNNNNLESLQSDAFLNLNRLEELDLYSNQIAFINEAVFKDLKMLKSVNLESNRLKFIKPSFFESLERLRAVNISRNQLDQNEKRNFKNTKFS
jgi:Leucine-rich repeat (LRR) protein